MRYLYLKEIAEVAVYIVGFGAIPVGLGVALVILAETPGWVSGIVPGTILITEAEAWWRWFC